MARLFYNSTGVHMQNGGPNSGSGGDDDIGESEQGSPERALGRGLLNLETLVTVEDEKQLDAATNVSHRPRSLASRVKAVLFGSSSDGEGKDLKGSHSPHSSKRKGYERFPSQVDLSRSLGLFAGVFAPVALGQFANNLFLRTGECLVTFVCLFDTALGEQSAIAQCCINEFLTLLT